MKSEQEKNFETSEPSNAADGVSEPQDGKAVIIPDSAEVDKAMRTSVYTSMGVGIVPIPFFNFAAASASNLNLVRKLSILYGVEFKEGAFRKIVTSVIGAGTSSLASPAIATIAASVPLIGLPLAIGTQPILNAMTTYAVGRMFIKHFERGGTFIGANVDAMKQDFSTAFKNSREWVGDAIKGSKAAEAVS